MNFSLLNAACMYELICNLEAATILYRMLGGDKDHVIVDSRMRWNGWGGLRKQQGEVQSFEILAQDSFGVCYCMTVRLLNNLDDLAEIEEHPFAGVWERDIDNRFQICRPIRALVYLTEADLPEGKLVCRYGYPLMPSDISLPAELPTQIISASVNDGSELAEFMQYLKSPDPKTQKYGRLSQMAEELRTEWEQWRRNGTEEL